MPQPAPPGTTGPLPRDPLALARPESAHLVLTEGDATLVAALEVTLGYHFRDPRLSLEALTHRSYAYESPTHGMAQNERLESLGDAVLGFIAADLIFTRVPQANEGKLTTLRAELIRTTTLARIARELRLGQMLRLGRGHASAQALGDRVWASTFEAIVGALYRDGGLAAAEAFLNPLLTMELERVLADTELKDDKTRLQDLAQTRLGKTPLYRTVSTEGQSHEPRFIVEVVLGDLVAGSGEGRTKRQAEQAAAKRALEDPGWEQPAEDASGRHAP
jgi:ribonuclease-3